MSMRLTVQTIERADAPGKLLVTATGPTKGFPLAAATGMSLALYANERLYAISAAGTISVIVLEAGL